MGKKWPVKFSLKCDFHGNCRSFLHATKLRHGTDGFTSPPKESTLRNFSPEKSDGSTAVEPAGPRANHQITEAAIFKGKVAQEALPHTRRPEFSTYVLLPS
jgi:hypothetical protein